MHHCLHMCSGLRWPFICREIKCVQHINKCSLHAAWHSQLLNGLQLCHIIIQICSKGSKKKKKRKRKTYVCCSWKSHKVIRSIGLVSSPQPLLCLVFVHGLDISHSVQACPWPLLNASQCVPSLNRLWELCLATRCR